MRSKNATYTRSAFFDDVTHYLRAELPPELRDFQTRRFGHLMKLYYQNERVHFEVWADSERSQIEMGLHFEDGAESTAAYLGFFDDRIVEIKEHTGPALELERWTKSWGHLVEFYPLEPFDRERALMIGERMAVCIRVLQPLVEEADVDTAERPVYTRPYWSRRRS